MRELPIVTLSAVTIEPDTKDWTWVLQRPCPECGFDAGTMPREQVAASIRANAEDWLEVLRGQVRQRPAPDRWSALEYACHVRDVLVLYDVRLRLMLAEDDPLYENWDQDATAIAERYGEQDPVQVAVELSAAARGISDRFAGLEPRHWSRPGRRSDGAAFTVESFSRYFLHDLVHHLHDVRPRPDAQCHS